MKIFRAQEGKYADIEDCRYPGQLVVRSIDIDDIRYPLSESNKAILAGQIIELVFVREDLQRLLAKNEILDVHLARTITNLTNVISRLQGVLK